VREPGLNLLTGAAVQVAQVTKPYRVYYARQDPPGGNYSVGHTSVIDVIDPHGRFAAKPRGRRRVGTDGRAAEVAARRD
jgi:cytochrome oxidase Cu insertion factor (SCO1/SenC/PrrC family)